MKATPKFPRKLIDINAISEYTPELKKQIGGKGASLVLLRHVGQKVHSELDGTLKSIIGSITVPFAVAIPIFSLKHLRNDPNKAVRAAKRLAKKAADIFKDKPVSVRSSGEVSMPGMMDTVLNVNIPIQWNVGELTVGEASEKTVCGYSNGSNERVALLCKGLGISQSELKKIYDSKNSFVKMLTLAILKVWFSWFSDKAVAYRNENIHQNFGVGTAVIIQSMVFGDANSDSFSGVYFNRNATGSVFHGGEYILGGQGELLVSGGDTSFKMTFPTPNLWSRYCELLGSVASTIEKEWGWFGVDLEYTVEAVEYKGKFIRHFYLLQARPLKHLDKVRQAEQEIKKSISEASSYKELCFTLFRSIEELRNTNSKTYYLYSSVRGMESDHDGNTLVHWVKSAGTHGIDLGRKYGAIARVAFNSDEAEEFIMQNIPYILAAETTDTSLYYYMTKACGLITAVGGTSSHAALVARELGIPAAVGISKEHMNYLHNWSKIVFPNQQQALCFVGFNGAVAVLSEEILSRIETTKSGCVSPTLFFDTRLISNLSNISPSGYYYFDTKNTRYHTVAGWGNGTSKHHDNIVCLFGSSQPTAFLYRGMVRKTPTWFLYELKFIREDSWTPEDLAAFEQDINTNYFTPQSGLCGDDGFSIKQFIDSSSILEATDKACEKFLENVT